MRATTKGKTAMSGQPHTALCVTKCMLAGHSHSAPLFWKLPHSVHCLEFIKDGKTGWQLYFKFYSAEVLWKTIWSCGHDQNHRHPLSQPNLSVKWLQSASSFTLSESGVNCHSLLTFGPGLLKVLKIGKFQVTQPPHFFCFMYCNFSPFLLGYIRCKGRIHCDNSE
jgi:hypothetical protein